MHAVARQHTGSYGVSICDAARAECELHKLGQNWCSDQAGSNACLSVDALSDGSVARECWLSATKTEPRGQRCRVRPRSMRHNAYDGRSRLAVRVVAITAHAAIATDQGSLHHSMCSSARCLT